MTVNHGGEEERLAPVIPLFGSARESDSGEGAPSARHPAARATTVRARTARTDAESTDPQSSIDAARPLDSAPPRDPEPPFDSESIIDPEETRERAEAALVRKLRAKALSISEARAVLRENDLDRDAIDDVIDDFSARGYIDDRTLASLLVTSGVERKGQGRVALARSLSQRGIPREIIDEALAELPDDDAERALEYARSKAPGMARLEPETALRRLLGQLARRGYGGSAAMNAARTALREAGSGRTGVRFIESD